MGNLVQSLISRSAFKEALEIEQDVLKEQLALPVRYEQDSVRVGGSGRHPALDILNSRVTLARIKSYMGLHMEARKEQEELLKGRKSTHGSNDTIYLYTARCLTHTLLRMGELEKAETLGYRTWRDYCIVCGEGHPLTLIAAEIIAEVYYDMKSYTVARDILREALDLYIKNRGEHHPKTQQCFKSLRKVEEFILTTKK